MQNYEAMQLYKRVSSKVQLAYIVLANYFHENSAGLEPLLCPEIYVLKDWIEDHIEIEPVQWSGLIGEDALLLGSPKTSWSRKRLSQSWGLTAIFRAFDEHPERINSEVVEMFQILEIAADKLIEGLIKKRN